VNGKNHYVIILHPYQATDLRKDSVWTQAQREANVRGEKNPIFSGALGIYNDCIIHEHEDIYAWNGGANSIPVCRAVLLGQQAGAIAYGASVNWVEKSFDYGNKWGISVGRIFGVIKPMFNAKDYGVIAIDTAGTTASTA
jgi:N4-gp56 family major capsid protein